MALSTGSKVLYTDYQAAKDAVNALYTTIGLTAPTYTTPVAAVGVKMEDHHINDLANATNTVESSYYKSCVNTPTYCSSHRTTHKGGYYATHNNSKNVTQYGIHFSSHRRGYYATHYATHYSTWYSGWNGTHYGSYQGGNKGTHYGSVKFDHSGS